MEVTLLGTGAPLHGSRVTTGMLVKAEGCAPLLLDTCGGFELTRALQNADCPLAQVRNVIVTHRHFDHSGGMMALFMANMPLDIHALDDTYAGICEMKAGSIPDTELHPEVRHHRVQFDERREIGGLTVEFLKVEHRVPTVAVRIAHRGRTFAFSADSLPCEGLIAAARNADLFVCDTMCAERDGEVESSDRLDHFRWLRQRHQGQIRCRQGEPVAGGIGVTSQHERRQGRIATRQVFREIRSDCELSGLPLVAIPGIKLESGGHRPASGLAEAERRRDRMLTARLSPGPVVDSRATSAA